MATITISAQDIHHFRYTATSVYLRLYLNAGFVTSDSEPLQPGSPSGGRWYKQVTCTVASNILSIPSFTLDSTVDGLDITTARYSAFFFDATTGRQLGVFAGFESFKVGSTPTTTTWDDLRTYNFTRTLSPDNSSYTKDQSDARYQLASSAVSNPMSALGDSIYGGASGVFARLAGNTTSTKKYLTQTGTGTVSAAPDWSALASGDVTGALGYTPLSAASNLSDVASAATSRTNLGLAIGTNVQAFDATLAALAAYNTNGLLTQTSADTFTGRTITGTTNRTTVTNGDGISGNPTIDISSSYVGQSTITTLGTVATGVWNGTGVTVPYGGTGVSTLASNGVLYGNGAGVVQVTAQGAANSLLQANAGAPAFTATPTTDRFTVNPASLSYDLISSTFAPGFNFGNGTPATPITINIPVNKQHTSYLTSFTNSGVGKGFGFEAQIYATGATQDSGNEPIRAFIGRVTNSGTGNAKTSCARFGATGSGSNASLLVGVDADITVVAGTNNVSKIYAATLFGSTNDVASGLIIESNDGGRLLLGVGNINAAIPINNAYYRAWMATASAANARAFEVLNNAGAQVGYIGKNGELATGLAGTQSGSILVSGSTSGVITIQPQVAAGTYNFNLPTSAGTSGQPLLSGGGSSTAMSFGTLGETAGGTNQTTYAQGDVLYASASNTLSKLAKDTNATRYLANTGTSNNPAWAQVSLATGVTGTLPSSSVSSLGWILIQTQAASSSATIDFTTGLDDTYDSYMVVVSNAKPATDDTELWLRIGTGAGPTYQASGYVWGSAALIVGIQNLYGTSAGGSTARISLTEVTGSNIAVGNASGENFSGRVFFSNPEVTDFCEVSWDAQYSRAAGNQTVRMSGGGRYDTAGVVTGFRFLFSSGNISSGRFSLYGLRKS